MRRQPCSRARARTASARRSSISRNSAPPGSSSGAAPASRRPVASNPSSPLTSAARGSYCATAGSSAAYSATVRYGGFETITRQRSPASGASRSPSRTSTGVVAAVRSTFSRASAAAPDDRSTAITRSKKPSTASERAIQPQPVPISAATPPFPRPPSPFPHSSTSSTSPSVSGRGIKARRSSFRSSARNPVRPTAYGNGVPLTRSRTASQNSSVTSAGASPSRFSHTSPGFVPSSAAQIAVASRRGFNTPARSRSAVASPSAVAIDTSGTPLFLPCELDRGDEIVQVAVEYFGNTVGRVVDAMVGDPVLGNVVGTDLLRPVAGANLRTPLARPRRLLLRHHPVQQPGPEDLERLDLVLQLRLLVLAFHFEAGRQVRDAHRAVGRVDALPAGAAGAEHVDAQVLVIDLDVDLLGLGEDRDGRRRRVDAPLRLGDRHALHAVHAGLVAQRSVHLGAAHREHGFLEPAEGALAQAQHLDLPAVALAEARVHAEQGGGEQRGLVAAGAGADLHDGVTVVEGVGGAEQLGETPLGGVDLGFQTLHVGAGELRQLRILLLQHLAGLVHVAVQALEAGVELPDRLESCGLAAQLLQLGWVARGGGVRQLPGDLLRPRERLAEAGVHGLAGGLVRGVVRPVLLAEALHPARRVQELLLPGVERMALGADFHVDHRGGAPGDERIAAGALNGGALIIRMNTGLHVVPVLCTNALWFRRGMFLGA